MLKIEIDQSLTCSLEFTEANIKSASIGELADALELLHYLARDLKHQDMGWKILEVSDTLKERLRNA